MIYFLKCNFKKNVNYFQGQLGHDMCHINEGTDRENKDGSSDICTTKFLVRGFVNFILFLAFLTSDV